MMIRVLASTMQAGVLLSLYAACAITDPLVIDFSAATTGKPLDRIEDCAVRIASVMDERKSKEDLGMFEGQVVKGRQVMPWLQQAVDSLNPPNVETVSRKGDPVQSRRLAVQVGLTQLYVEHLPRTVAATLVLHATYQIDHGPPQSQQYRGADTKMNWTGSAGSLRTLLNAVLEDVVRRMHADIQQHCQSGREKSGT